MNKTDPEPEINQWCLIWIGSEVPIVACYKGDAKFIAHQSLEIWEKEDITNWMPVPAETPSHTEGEQAVAFAEWITDNQFTKWNNQWSSTKIHYSPDKYTTQELYTLFTQINKTRFR